MHVLIVEDSSFNAFCLTRLLQTANRQIQVTVVNNSLNALIFIQKNKPSFIILDGDLRPSDELHCNGPALAEAIWQIYPDIPIIAWTDSEPMRKDFSEVFTQHHTPFNEYYVWPKVISQKKIVQSLGYIMLGSCATSPNEIRELPKMAFYQTNERQKPLFRSGSAQG